MGRRRTLILPLLLLGLLLPGAVGQDAPAAGHGERLLVPIYFYKGYVVGRSDLPTGLMASVDGGRTFAGLTWPELISSSVTVGPRGRRVYLACGNGVMVSADGGRNFRLTGGWEVAEVQRIAVDPADPKRAWAATAYGVARTEDVDAPGEPWIPPDPDGAFRYSTDVALDPGRPGTLWAAAHRGIFRSDDGGATWAPVLEGVPVRRILLSGGRILAATDGRGLLVSADGGESFARLAGVPDVVFSVEGRPGLLAAGTMEGLFVSRDDGKTWTGSAKGLPERFEVFGIAFDPQDENRIVVSGNRGLYESTDGGGSFSLLAFEDAIVPDVRFAWLDDSEPAPAPDEPGVLELRVPEKPYAEHRPSGEDALAARKREALARIAGVPVDPDRFPGWARATALVAAGKADAALWDSVRAALAKPSHSMFLSLPLTGFFLHAREALPADVAARIREVLTGNTFYRGDTENHWVMHYSALLLATETWPETPASAWYMHRSTADLHAEAKGWLLHWARLTASKGQGEFDSPHYVFMYVAPLLLLYDFARDAEVRQAAGMALDLLLADCFAESLCGAWCGGHSRIMEREVVTTKNTRASVLHWLFAGGIPRPRPIHPWMAFAALSSYRPPSVLEAVANRRDRPYVHTEVKRVRNVLRFGRELNPIVRKTDYMTARYGMGSLQGGILQPIQQHTWDVTWRSEATNATLFTVHPSVSARELGMFFPEEIHDITATIAAQKGTYVNPGKLVSASPWERVYQRENVLLALYAVPAGEKFPHVGFYVPDCLATEEEGRWLFGRDGEFFVAVWRAREAEWGARENARVETGPADRAGYVVFARPAGDSGSYADFRESVLAAPEPTLRGGGAGLTLAWTDPGGRRHGFTFGKPPPFPDDRIFTGPFLSGRVGTGIVRITDGERVRTLDFERLEIFEEER